jgi:hypothetical protein
MWPILVVAIGVLVAARRNELFLLSIRQGEVLHVRGRIPLALRDALADVIRDARVERGSVRAVRGPEHARLVVRGADERTAQRLRNVFGTNPIRLLRTAPRASNENFGQMLGWTWLAWLLLRR